MSDLSTSVSHESQPESTSVVNPSGTPANSVVFGNIMSNEIPTLDGLAIHIPTPSLEPVGAPAVEPPVVLVNLDEAIPQQLHDLWMFVRGLGACHHPRVGCPVCQAYQDHVWAAQVNPSPTMLAVQRSIRMSELRPEIGAMIRVRDGERRYAAILEEYHALRIDLSRTRANLQAIIKARDVTIREMSEERQRGYQIMAGRRRRGPHRVGGAARDNEDEVMQEPAM